MKSCKTCKYSIPYVDGGDKVLYYECRFNPPQTTMVPKVIGSNSLMEQWINYPRLTEIDWCFQYMKRKSK